MKNEWDEALGRVQAFLAALEIGGTEHQARIALQVLDRARACGVETSPAAPVERAMKLVAEDLETWFAQALPDVPARQRVAIGVVALRITGAAERWPDVVLAREAPEEMKALLAGITVRTGPDLAVSRMTPRPMDYGAMETLAQETWHSFAWAPLARAAALWTALFFLGLFLLERFFPQ